MSVTVLVLLAMLAAVFVIAGRTMWKLRRGSRKRTR
jgi:hypothetical protein